MSTKIQNVLQRILARRNFCQLRECEFFNGHAVNNNSYVGG
jgi:hypothetical protein